jgi:hypothetical protein
MYAATPPLSPTGNSCAKIGEANNPNGNAIPAVHSNPVALRRS